jgi:hypothetical protein
MRDALAHAHESEASGSGPKLVLIGVLLGAACLIAIGLFRPVQSKAGEKADRAPAVSAEQTPSTADATTPGDKGAPGTQTSDSAGAKPAKGSEPAAPVESGTFTEAGFAAPAQPRYLNPHSPASVPVERNGVEVTPEGLDPRTPVGKQAAADQALQHKLAARAATQKGAPAGE